MGGYVSERPLILIVEDEYFLQADLVQALNRAGFDADAAFSGEEALTMFASGERHYDALITDVRLGDGLHGWEVARQIREKDPAFPVIYLTASAVEEWSTQGVPNSILIPKPFLPRQLVSTLSSLLSGQASVGRQIGHG